MVYGTGQRLVQHGISTGVTLHDAGEITQKLWIASVIDLNTSGSHKKSTNLLPILRGVKF